MEINHPNIRLTQGAFESIKEIILLMALQNCTTYYLDGKKHFESFYRSNRSCNDIFGVVKYYFPQTTADQFLEITAELLKNKKIDSQYCKSIRKQTLVPRWNGGSFYHDLPKDKWGVAGNSRIATRLRKILNNTTNV